MQVAQQITVAVTQTFTNMMYLSILSFYRTHVDLLVSTQHT